MNSQRVSDFMSRKGREKKIALENFVDIAAYPQNHIKEIAKIMTDVNINCMPVFSSPWNKKLIGFIELNKIKIALRD